MRIIIGIIGSLIVSLSSAAAENPGCEAEWGEFLRKHREETLLQLVELWRREGLECKDRAAYWLKMAGLYVDINAHAEAEEAISKAESEGGSVSRDEVEVLRLDMQFNEALKKNTPDESWKILISSYQSLRGTTNRDALIEQRISTIHLILEQYEKSISAADRGLILRDSWLFHRNKTIAHFNLGNYELCIESFDHAFQGNPEIFSQPDIMYAVARAYAALGKFELANRVLAILLKKKPEVEKVPEFLEAVTVVRHLQAKARSQSQD